MSANNWAFYEKGIFENNDDDAVVNHAVLLVGYGVDDCTGEKYYKLRNSWGPGFGEGGEFVFPLLEATVIKVNYSPQCAFIYFNYAQATSGSSALTMTKTYAKWMTNHLSE